MKKKGQFHEDTFNPITEFTSPTFLEIKKQFKDYCTEQGLNNSDGHFNSTHPRYQEVEAKRREVAQWAVDQWYDSLSDPPPFGRLKMPDQNTGGIPSRASFASFNGIISESDSNEHANDKPSKPRHRGRLQAQTGPSTEPNTNNSNTKPVAKLAIMRR
jgi:hypothetical protein